MKKKILLILADGFEEIEALGTLDIWRRFGLTVKVAAWQQALKVTGAHGVCVEAESTLAEEDFAVYDALFLPGGMPGSSNLYASDAVLECVKEFAAAGKFTCAICAAPMVLGKAGLLEDGCFTMYPSEELRNVYIPRFHPVKEMVVHHKRVITGRGPGAVAPFAAEVARALGVPEEKIDQVYDGMLLPEEYR